MTTTTQQLQNQPSHQHFSSKNLIRSTPALSVSSPVTISKATSQTHSNRQQINYDAHQCTTVRWVAAAAGGGRERPNHPTTRTTPVDLVSGAVGPAGGWVWWC